MDFDKKLISKILIDIDNKLIGIQIQNNNWAVYKYGIDDELPKNVQNFIDQFTRTITLRS